MQTTAAEVSRARRRDDAAAMARRCLEMARLWRRHDEASTTIATTVFATQGVASPAGRLADRSRFVNLLEVMYLEDAAWDYARLSPTPEDYRGTYAPTEAAATMIRHKIVATTRRKVPLTPEARAAALAYLAEREALLAETLTLLSEPRHRSAVKRHMRLVAKLRALLTEVTASYDTSPDTV